MLPCAKPAQFVSSKLEGNERNAAVHICGRSFVQVSAGHTTSKDVWEQLWDKSATAEHYATSRKMPKRHVCRLGSKAIEEEIKGFAAQGVGLRACVHRVGGDDGSRLR